MFSLKSLFIFTVITSLANNFLPLNPPDTTSGMCCITFSNWRYVDSMTKSKITACTFGYSTYFKMSPFSANMTEFIDIVLLFSEALTLPPVITNVFCVLN